MGLSKKAAKAKEPVIKKSIVQWCNDLHQADGQLALIWDGGGDSGWVHFELDGETIENEYTECLVERMYDTLNYGSWAGEFSASGKAMYNPQTNAFEGVDYYGEDGHDAIDVNFKIHVPKKLWFDTLHIEVESYNDESPNVSVRLLIKNGFLTQEHSDFCSNLETTLTEKFNDVFYTYESKTYDFRGCSDSWILERANAIEGENDLIFEIVQVEIQTIDSEERAIVLELDEETAAAIDEQLNDE